MPPFNGRNAVTAAVTVLAALSPAVSAAAIPTDGDTTLSNANIENPFCADNTTFASGNELTEHSKREIPKEAAAFLLEQWNCRDGFSKGAKAAGIEVEVEVANPPCLAIQPGKDCVQAVKRRGYHKPEMMVPEAKEGKDQKEEDEELHQFEKRIKTNAFWPKCPWGS